jgi:signal transduction histidine kinase
MELHHIRLIGFATGALILGLQTALIGRQWRKAHGLERRRVLECGLFCLVTFFWQFGNLADEAALAMGFGTTDGVFRVTYFIRRGALYLVPLSLSYLSPLFGGLSGPQWLSRLGRWLRAGLWPWTAAAISYQTVWLLGWKGDARLTSLIGQTSVRLIVAFLALFMVQSIHQILTDGTAKQKRLQAANVVGLVACFVGISILVAADWMNSAAYVRVGAMLTLITLAIAAAYRQYQFPFMDVFIPHATTGVLLLCLLIGGVAAGEAWIQPSLMPLWLVALAMALMYVKEPLVRWVERVVMGFDESIESQENRLGSAIRGLLGQDELVRWTSTDAAVEMNAEWAELATVRRPDAALSFVVPGSEPMWLCIGPRLDGRPHMSRQLRLGQTTALQLAAQYERVIREDFERRQLISQHELREMSSRAQIQALQAQIRPHFLFNTLNVLSNLIHTDARKAEDLTEELAAVFRYTLDATHMEWVTLEEEIRFVTSYLRIEKARFEGRLNYSIELQPETKSLRIPPMILQPLVENAVRHGVSTRTEGGVVLLTAKAVGGRLVLMVQDTGKGMKSEENLQGHGIGLKNVRDRLKHVYREQADLELSSVEPGGTRVILTLPELVEAHA